MSKDGGQRRLKFTPFTTLVQAVRKFGSVARGGGILAGRRAHFPAP